MGGFRPAARWLLGRGSPCPTREQGGSAALPAPHQVSVPAPRCPPPTSHRSWGRGGGSEAAPRGRAGRRPPVPSRPPPLPLREPPPPLPSPSPAAAAPPAYRPAARRSPPPPQAASGRRAAAAAGRAAGARRGSAGRAAASGPSQRRPRSGSAASFPSFPALPSPSLPSPPRSEPLPAATTAPSAPQRPGCPRGQRVPRLSRRPAAAARARPVHGKDVAPRPPGSAAARREAAERPGVPVTQLRHDSERRGITKVFRWRIPAVGRLSAVFLYG